MKNQFRNTRFQWLLQISPQLILFTIIVFAGIYTFAELAVEIYDGKGFRFDRTLLTFAAEQQRVTLDAFFRIVTRAGSFYVLAPVAIIMIMILLWQHKQAEATILGFGFGGAALVSFTTKFLLLRERPDMFPQLIDITIPQSFPSGHTTQITAFSIAIFIIIRRLAPHWKLATGLLLALVTLLVAGSRIYLQVHYPSDVLAGLVLGISWVIGTNLLLKMHHLTT